MAKKVLRLTFGLSQQRLSVCLTKNSYNKEMQKLANVEYDTFGHAVTTTIFGEGIDDDRYVIGIHADKKMYSILQIKALVVHELNHAVHKHMKFHGFEDEEYACTLIQQLYIDVMPFVNKHLKIKE